MTATAHMRGHTVFWDSAAQVWRYQDTNEVATAERDCIKCHKPPTPEGYDPCMGHIPGAVSVCCGHGVADGGVMWGGECERVTTTVEGLPGFLRYLRNEAGLTLKELGEQVGKSIGFLSDIERGRVNPSFQTLQDLAGVYGKIIVVEIGINLRGTHENTIPQDQQTAKAEIGRRGNASTKRQPQP